MLSSQSDSNDRKQGDLSDAQPNGFAQFANLLEEGDSDAANRLLQRYAVRLRAIAARRITNELRPKFDPEDVVQSVLGNFFANLRAGKYDLDSSQNLRGLLAIMVARKCARYTRRYTSARRALSRERSASHVDRDREPLDLFVDRRPLPGESVLLAELFEQWMSDFDSLDRRILELLLLGYTTAEITLQVHCSQRTVQRTVQRFIQRSGLAATP